MNPAPGFQAQTKRKLKHLSQSINRPQAIISLSKASARAENSFPCAYVSLYVASFFSESLVFTSDTIKRASAY